MTDRVSVDPYASLRPSDRAHNLLVGDNVEIDPTAQIGANVVIHDDVVIGPGALIKHGAVVGAPPSLPAGSRAERLPPATTRIGAGAMVCLHSVVMTGAQIGEEAVVADHATLREHAKMGDGSVLGRASVMGARASMGARTRVQGVCLITPRAVIEEDVFLGGGVILTTDDTLARQHPDSRSEIILRRACRIASGVTITPHVEVGEEAFVAAGAVVVKDVGAREKVMGIPARVYGTVADDELLDRWR